MPTQVQGQTGTSYSLCIGHHAVTELVVQRMGTPAGKPDKVWGFGACPKTGRQAEK